MRSFRSLAVLSGEDDLEGICSSQVDSFGQRFVLNESERNIRRRNSLMLRDVSYFSLKLPPTPVPFPCTDSVASVKLHDAAAKLGMAEASRRDSFRSGGEKCISKGVVKTVQSQRGWSRLQPRVW